MLEHLSDTEVDALLVVTEADWAHFFGHLEDWPGRFEFVGEEPTSAEGTIRWHDAAGDALLYAACQRAKGSTIFVFWDNTYDARYGTITQAPSS